MPVLSDCFGLIRVINLPDRTDRLQEVTLQLADLGMQFSPGRVELYAATRVTERKGFDSLGTRGCYLSHLEVLRDARDRGVESVLVMEDDCQVVAQHREEVVRMAATLQERPWGFVYLGHILPAPAQVQPGLVAYDGPLQTTVLYGVHRDVLPPLIDYLESCLTRPEGDPIGGPMPVDGAITMFRAAHPEIVTLIAQPVMATQRSSRSDISFRRFELLPGIKQAMGWARVMRRRMKGLR